MKSRVVDQVMMVVVSVVSMSLASCSTGKDASDKVSVVSMDDGVRAVETMSMNATVTAKNTASRKITLRSDAGGDLMFTAGPEMANFDQLTVGDKVHAVVTEEVAIYIGAGAPSSATTEGGAMLSPEGAEPGGVYFETHQVTVTVVAVDATRHRISLQLPDGSIKKLKVSKEVDLSHVAEGDNLIAVVSEGLALEITTP